MNSEDSENQSETEMVKKMKSIAKESQIFQWVTLRGYDDDDDDDDFLFLLDNLSS